MHPVACGTQGSVLVGHSFVSDIARDDVPCSWWGHAAFKRTCNYAAIGTAVGMAFAAAAALVSACKEVASPAGGGCLHRYVSLHFVPAWRSVVRCPVCMKSLASHGLLQMRSGVLSAGRLCASRLHARLHGESAWGVYTA